MSIAQFLQTASQQLIEAGVTSARLDALLLLEDCLQRDRAWLLAHDDAPLTAAQTAALEPLIARRLNHEPLAYIRGHAEFYGRSFSVNDQVLVPRPESEALIELFKKYAPPAARVADIGTGSGALAITAALETDAVVSAVDIDEACLTVARQNAGRHTAQISFYHGDLLLPLAGLSTAEQPQVLLCNLPYVPDNYQVNRAAQHEPAKALFAGADGLDLYRALWQQISQHFAGVSIVITEALPAQQAALAKLAQAHGFKLAQTDHYGQCFIR